MSILHSNERFFVAFLKLIRIGCGFIFIMWSEIKLFCLFWCISAGWRPVWPGDELHHPGAREHRVHGGAAGQVRVHLSGGGLEHLHRHPQEERPQPAGVHRSGAHPASAGPHLHNWQHDCRWKSSLLFPPFVLSEEGEAMQTWNILYKINLTPVWVPAGMRRRQWCSSQPPSFLSLLPICKLVRINPNAFGSVNPRQNTAGLEGLCRRAGVISASSHRWATRVFSSKFPHRF